MCKDRDVGWTKLDCERRNLKAGRLGYLEQLLKSLDKLEFADDLVNYSYWGPSVSNEQTRPLKKT